MLLDTPTMYKLLCLGNFIIFIMMIVFSKATQCDRLFARYAYGKLLQSIGMLLIASQGVILEAFSAIAGSCFVIVGIMLEAFCLLYVGRRPHYNAAKGWIRVVMLLVVGFCLVNLTAADMVIRSAIISLVIGLVMATVAIGLLVYNKDAKLRRVSGFFFSIFSIMLVFRAIGALLYKTGYPALGSISGQTFDFFMAYGYMLISTMAFILMSREAIGLKLQQAATCDFLTGIYNRGHAMTLAKKLFSLMIRQRRPISVLMIDLDHFKAVNDKYGHFIGDEVLVNFTHKTAALLREEAVFGRYGGEEFIVFCPNTDAQEAAVIAKRIKGGQTPDFTTKQILPNYTVSIGTATIIPTDLADMAKLMKMADEALFQAKRTGRNKVIQYG